MAQHEVGVGSPWTHQSQGPGAQRPALRLTVLSYEKGGMVLLP